MEEAWDEGILLFGKINRRRHRRKMEAIDSVLSRRRDTTFRRVAEAHPRPDQENTYTTSERVGTRPGDSAKGVRGCASEGGVFIDPPRRKLEADSQVDVGLGHEAPRP